MRIVFVVLTSILMSAPALAQWTNPCILAYNAKIQASQEQAEACEAGPYNPTTGDPCPDWPECCEQERIDRNQEAYEELLRCLGISEPPGGGAFVLFSHNEQGSWGGPADWNLDASIDSADLFAFLDAFFEGGADHNLDGATNSLDFFDFLADFLG